MREMIPGPTERVRIDEPTTRQVPRTVPKNVGGGVGAFLYLPRPLRDPVFTRPGAIEGLRPRLSSPFPKTEIGVVGTWADWNLGLVSLLFSKVNDLQKS